MSQAAKEIPPDFVAAITHPERFENPARPRARGFGFGFGFGILTGILAFFAYLAAATVGSLAEYGASFVAVSLAAVGEFTILLLFAFGAYLLWKRATFGRWSRACRTGLATGLLATFGIGGLALWVATATTGF